MFLVLVQRNKCENANRILCESWDILDLSDGEQGAYTETVKRDFRDFENKRNIPENSTRLIPYTELQELTTML